MPISKRKARNWSPDGSTSDHARRAIYSANWLNCEIRGCRPLVETECRMRPELAADSGVRFIGGREITTITLRPVLFPLSRARPLIRCRCP